MKIRVLCLFDFIAEAILSAIRSHPLGERTAIIGEVTPDHPGFVLMKTRIGGSRIVDMLSGEQLPPHLLIGPRFVCMEGYSMTNKTPPGGAIGIGNSRIRLPSLFASSRMTFRHF